MLFFATIVNCLFCWALILRLEFEYNRQQILFFYFVEVIGWIILILVIKTSFVKLFIHINWSNKLKDKNGNILSWKISRWHKIHCSSSLRHPSRGFQWSNYSPSKTLLSILTKEKQTLLQLKLHTSVTYFF